MGLTSSKNFKVLKKKTSITKFSKKEKYVVKEVVNMLSMLSMFVFEMIKDDAFCTFQQGMNP